MIPILDLLKGWFIGHDFNQQTDFYMATLKIGSNEDENRVLVDTGSSDLWVMSHDLKCVSAPNSKRNERSFGHGTGVKLNERELMQKRKNLYQPSRTIETDEEKEALEKIHNKLFGFGSIYSTVYITEGPGAYSTFSPFVELRVVLVVVVVPIPVHPMVHSIPKTQTHLKTTLMILKFNTLMIPVPLVFGVR